VIHKLIKRSRFHTSNKKVFLQVEQTCLCGVDSKRFDVQWSKVSCPNCLKLLDKRLDGV